MLLIGWCQAGGAEARSAFVRCPSVSMASAWLRYSSPLRDSAGTSTKKNRARDVRSSMCLIWLIHYAATLSRFFDLSRDASFLFRANASYANSTLSERRSRVQPPARPGVGVCRQRPGLGCRALGAG